MIISYNYLQKDYCILARLKSKDCFFSFPYDYIAMDIETCDKSRKVEIYACHQLILNGPKMVQIFGLEIGDSALEFFPCVDL